MCLLCVHPSLGTSEFFRYPRWDHYGLCGTYSSEGRRALDRSFLRLLTYLHRFYPLSPLLTCSLYLVNMNRKVLKDFVLSDGTVVPAGNTIAVASFSMHHDGVSLCNS
jgi:hypothetical protein